MNERNVLLFLFNKIVFNFARESCICTVKSAYIYIRISLLYNQFFNFFFMKTLMSHFNCHQTD